MFLPSPVEIASRLAVFSSDVFKSGLSQALVDDMMDDGLVAF
jgi:hypothetical protein